MTITNGNNRRYNPIVNLHPNDFVDITLAAQSAIRRARDSVIGEYRYDRIPVMEPMTARELIDSAPVPDWIIEGVLPSPSCSLLYSQAKAGKTTMLVSWLKHMQDGSPWAGRQVKQTTALYLTEEGGATMGMTFQHMGLDLDGPHLFLSDVRAGEDWTWENTLARACLYAVLWEIDLIIIDTLMVWAKASDSNSYTEMIQLMRAARAAVHEFGVTVLMVHHDRKGHSSDIEAALGSTALVGGPDHLIHFTKSDDNKRRLNFDSRYRQRDQDGKFLPLHDMAVRLTEDGTYEATVLSAGYEGEIRNAFKKSGKTRLQTSELMVILNMSRGKIRTRTKSGVENGWLVQIESGNDTAYELNDELTFGTGPDDED